MQLYARVRRAVVVDKMSEREAARQFGLAVRLLYCFFVIEPGLRRDRAIAADSNRLSHQEGETSHSCFTNTILTPQTLKRFLLPFSHSRHSNSARYVRITGPSIFLDTSFGVVN